ncbi:MAG: formylglycine-generating enzyme family protein [Planctomycetaceae bacterium]|nr:formylglycine-generating enzyme family protein [Planctomycetaceae bacterium]
MMRPPLKPAGSIPRAGRRHTALSVLLCLAVGVPCVGCGKAADHSPAQAPEGEALPEPIAVKEAPTIVDLPRSVNSAGIELVELPAGEFEMGAPDSDPMANPDEKPLHRAVIERPFSIAIHETTVGQFRRFVEATEYKTAAERTGEGGFSFNPQTRRLEPSPQADWRNTGFPQDDSHPVVNVNWDDAWAFCNWLSQVESVRYRLPTETEWEYACRAGTGSPWFFGDTEAAMSGAGNICDSSLRKAYPFAEWSMTWNDGYPFTAPVGSFPPNAFGVFDMHGNVFEWCDSDWNGADYAGKIIPDPTVTDLERMKVLRGGSYLSLMVFTRSSDRVALKWFQRNAITGFRVVHN